MSKYTKNIALEITENPKIENFQKVIDGAKNAYFSNNIAVEEEIVLTWGGFTTPIFKGFWFNPFLFFYFCKLSTHSQKYKKNGCRG